MKARTLNRDVPVDSYGGNVRVRGEALHPVLWHGRQWAVTEYGMECRDGTYVIEASRLREQEPEYSWQRHMAEKNWVDQADFARAFAVACLVHRGEAIPTDIEAAIIREARGV